MDYEIFGVRARERPSCICRLAAVPAARAAGDNVLSDFIVSRQDTAALTVLCELVRRRAVTLGRTMVTTTSVPEYRAALQACGFVEVEQRRRISLHLVPSAAARSVSTGSDHARGGATRTGTSTPTPGWPEAWPWTFPRTRRVGASVRLAPGELPHGDQALIRSSQIARARPSSPFGDALHVRPRGAQPGALLPPFFRTSGEGPPVRSRSCGAVRRRPCFAHVPRRLPPPWERRARGGPDATRRRAARMRASLERFGSLLEVWPELFAAAGRSFADGGSSARPTSRG